MRIEKFLSHMGFGSRKEVKKIISSGDVTVNRKIIKKSGFDVNEQTDEVTVYGKVVKFNKYVYIMLNKPKNVISATEDRKYKTVIDLLDEKYKNINLFPVGRLDIDTTGLLLLTNNGQLAHELLSPKKKIDKKYFAVIQGIVNNDDIEIFAKGMNLGDFTSQPSKLTIVDIDQEKKQSEIEVVIHEGKYHQVKRMFEFVDKKVIGLKRLSMGPLILDECLLEGDYRPLNGNEMEKLIPFGLE